MSDPKKRKLLTTNAIFEAQNGDPYPVQHGAGANFKV
jgi:hypothetical protein